jgi:hypothetical protein
LNQAELALKRCYEAYSKKFDVSIVMDAKREEEKKGEEEKKFQQEEEKRSRDAQSKIWEQQNWGEDLNWVNLLFAQPHKIVKQQFMLYQGALDERDFHDETTKRARKLADRDGLEYIGESHVNEAAAELHREAEFARGEVESPYQSDTDQTAGADNVADDEESEEEELSLTPSLLD